MSEGFAINGVYIAADALFLDVPNPWAAIKHAKRALKKRNYCDIKMEEYAVSLPV